MLRRRPTQRPYFAVAACGTALMLSTNVAAGLFPVYKQQGILTPGQMTMVFAIYVFTLIPCLLFSGDLARRHGYRAVLYAMLALALAGTMLLAAAPWFPLLLMARLLQGAAVGISSGVIAAALVALEPSGNTRNAAVTAGLTLTVGGGLGPILAGTYAQWGPAPLVAPYLAASALLLTCAFLTYRIPAPLGTGTPQGVRKPAVPKVIRAVFWQSAAATFLAWALNAVFLAVIPVAVLLVAPDAGFMIPGLAAGTVLIVSGLTQISSTRIPLRRALLVGLALLSIAAALVTAFLPNGTLVMVILAAVIAGVGHGLTHLAATASLTHRVSDRADAHEVLSALSVAMYAGIGVPTLAIGLIAPATGIVEAATAAAAAAGIGALVLSLATGRR